MRGVVVGIDVGTSRVKAVAVGLDGRIYGSAERGTPWRRAGDRTEVDPAALARIAGTVAAEAAAAANATIPVAPNATIPAARDAITPAAPDAITLAATDATATATAAAAAAAARTTTPATAPIPAAAGTAVTNVTASAVGGGRGAGVRVLGIGVTGMAETGVLVDGHDRPLAPAIAWHDPRADVDTIARELGGEAFRRTTGMPMTPLPSLGKLLWLRRNVPETKAAVRFYSVGEWVVRRFGGESVAELSLASRTGLLDVHRARPWDAAAALLGRPSLLPVPVVAGTPTGRASGEELPPALHGAVLTVAGHDHQVAAYGVGAATDGALFDSLGTAEALVRTVRPTLGPERIGALAAQGMTVGWGVVAGHLTVLGGLPTGLTLNRIAAMLGAVTAADRRALGERALAATAHHPGLRLVEPRDDRFGIAGITDGVTPPILWRTAIDGLVGEAERMLDRIDTLVGPYRDVVVAGGWLHDPALLAAKRRQYPAMRTTAVAEPGAYGAALLAAIAAGVPITAAATATDPATVAATAKDSATVAATADDPATAAAEPDAPTPAGVPITDFQMENEER